jgi:NADH-quinone oxidoreductase subunit C
MALVPPITDLEQLKDRPALAALLAWNHDAVQAARFDRNELTIYLERPFLREAAALLRDNPELRFTFLADITCIDWYPGEPRFEMVYELLSMKRKERVRLKVRVAGSDPKVESLTSLWPGANFFEREVFDLFGIHFEGHPYLRRIMMPEDWEGHPLRKDYPVEGYR